MKWLSLYPKALYFILVAGWACSSFTYIARDSTPLAALLSFHDMSPSFFLQTFHHACLHCLLHFVFRLYSFLRHAHSFRLLFASPPPTVISIRHDVHRLPKLPQHLTVLVPVSWLNDIKLFQQLARITCWSYAAGIPNVSFFDPYGFIVDNGIPLSKSLHQTMNEFSPEAMLKVSVLEQTYLSELRGQACANVNNVCECTTSPDINVILASPELGRKHMVRVLKNILKEEEKSKTTKRGDKIELLDVKSMETLLSVKSFTEPQLMLSFGDEVELAGYPPWYIRLTEIHLLPDTGDIHYHDFFRALRRYAECKQRFGK